MVGLHGKNHHVCAASGQYFCIEATICECLRADDIHAVSEAANGLTSRSLPAEIASKNHGRCRVILWLSLTQTFAAPADAPSNALWSNKQAMRCCAVLPSSVAGCSSLASDSCQCSHRGASASTARNSLSKSRTQSYFGNSCEAK